MSTHATVKFKNPMGYKTFRFPAVGARVLKEGRMIQFTHNGSGTAMASDLSMATLEAMRH